MITAYLSNANASHTRCHQHKKISLWLIIGLLFSLQAPMSIAGFEASSALLTDLIKQGRKPAIVIIDMQQQLAPGFVLEESEDVRRELNQMLRFAAKNDLPVVNVAFHYGDFDGTQSILSQLRKTRYRIYYKLERSAFSTSDKQRFFIENLPTSDLSEASNSDKIIRSDLAQTLKEDGTEDVFIGGCFDSGCVSRTVEDAAKNFNVYTDREMNVLFAKIDEEYDEFTQEALTDQEWERLKKENPNLRVIDRSFSKADRYCTESFI